MIRAKMRVYPPKTKRRGNALYVICGSIELPLLPEIKSQRDGVDFDRLPPSRFVAPPVKLTVVRTTERYGELVTDPSTEGLGLSEAQMVRVAWCSPAHKAWMACNKFQMLFVAQTNSFLRDRSPLGGEKGLGCLRRGGRLCLVSGIIGGGIACRGKIEFRKLFRKCVFDRGRVSRH